jgi:5-(aminomethyl)-3-furanmethanol phosphate kinase
MWVVKLGGSLGDSPALQCWLDILADHGGGKVVIVPGGGRFADQVRAAQRNWRFCDKVAHRMALLAMHQYGLMLTGLRGDLETIADPEEAKAVLRGGKVAVWLPAIERLDHEKISACWDVTSDALAAWLAQKLNAGYLALVKSVALTGPTVSAAQMVAAGVVDRAFPAYFEDAAFQVRLYSRDQYSRFRLALNGHDPGGSIAVSKLVDSNQDPFFED